MAEDIDIYDANLAPLGQMERIQAHMEGQWHRTFHCWVVSDHGNGGLIFQQRSRQMKNYPGLLDVSAAGHLSAGESVAEGARELREELGIPFSDSELIYLGERVEVADQSNGQRNREYQSVFMLRTSLDIAAFEPQAEEVTALLLVSLQDGMKLFTQQVDSVEAVGYTFDGSELGTWSPTRSELTVESFLPRIQRYYLTAFIMAERLLSNAGPLAIS